VICSHFHSGISRGFNNPAAFYALHSLFGKHQQKLNTW
jgi:hypothetical protein